MTVTETAVDTRVRQRREATVREHVDAENRHDPDATFSVDKARYDIPGFGEAGEVPDHDAIREMFTGMSPCSRTSTSTLDLSAMATTPSSSRFG
jgi:hypothetical protein